MASSAPSIILDNGSYCCKAGFACDNHPVAIVRTVVGRPKNLIGVYGKFPYEVYIGDEAIARSKDYDMYCPVVCGKIVNWDNMERVWHHIYYRELKVAPEERDVVITLATGTSLEDKVRCCEIFFENLNAPALSIQPQCVAALYGSGYTTGIAVDLGYDSTDINAIYEGGIIPYARTTTNLSGRDISNYIQYNLEKKLAKEGIDIGKNIMDIVTHLKEKVISVCPTPPEYCTKKKYKLPDGHIIDISPEAHCVPEMIFNPKLVLGNDTNITALHTSVITTAQICDADLHDELYSAIVVTGGLSATPGLSQRLGFEMEEALDKPVNIVDSSETYCLIWLGAAVFAGMKDVEKVWVRKKQFEEYGEKIVKNKFI